jgi:hypothetical protein
VGDYWLFIGIDQTHAQKRGRDDALLSLAVHKRFLEVIFGRLAFFAADCLL